MYVSPDIIAVKETATPKEADIELTVKDLADQIAENDGASTAAASIHALESSPLESSSHLSNTLNS